MRPAKDSLTCVALFKSTVLTPQTRCAPHQMLHHGAAAAVSNDHHLDAPMPQAVVPEDFDADAYLLWHPSLRHQGVNCSDAARSHYAMHGGGAGLMYKPCRVLYMYDAVGSAQGASMSAV